MSSREQQIQESWDYIIEDSSAIITPNKFQGFMKLMMHYKEEFIVAPAAKKMHHNYRGGLVIHTAQVIRYAQSIYRSSCKDNENIIEESVFICSALHDLHKVKTYSINEDNKVTRTNFRVEHDVWTVAEALKFEIVLTYDEMMGIFQAHGGWAKLNYPTHPLACIVHCADMISSQLLG